MSNANSVFDGAVASKWEPWQRLWVPEASWDLTPELDHSFLLPVDHATLGMNSLAHWADHPFLLLLGRPGAGKSRELQCAQHGDWLGASLRLDAADIASTPGTTLDSLLPVRDNNDAPLRLILDGLDEALLRNPRFVQELRLWFATRLGDDGTPLFRLALSSRWADWPVPAVTELASLWQTDKFPRLILCPLRREDADQTLQRRFGERSGLFWSQMHDRHLASIACWPQAMSGLMDEFAQTGQLATGLGQIIGDQVRRNSRLADNPDDTLRWEKSKENIEWRQRVAGRLAASMIWSGKPTIHVGAASREVSQLNESDLGITDELWHNDRKAVLIEDVNALVQHTRHLKRSGEGCAWRFGSQVHQEWLAADWLVHQKLDEARLRLLFGTTVEGTWAVYPPLSSVSAWLAQRQPDFRQILLKDDPLVLLRLDAATLPCRDREEIVEALLARTQDIGILDPGVRQAHFPSLKHPDLETQLRRWLEDTGANDAAKELALEIAEKTQLKSLSSLLWRIYPAASRGLKIEIAGALRRLAIHDNDAEWRKVLAGKHEIDAYGTLLGTAFQVLVPSKVPVREVLKWLVPRTHFEVHGLAEMEMQGVHKHLTLTDLPHVFASLFSHHEIVHDSFSIACKLNEAALKLACTNIRVPEVVEALTDYWFRCLTTHFRPHLPPNETWKPSVMAFSSDSNRRWFVARLLLDPRLENVIAKDWLWPSDYLLLEQDFEWCLDNILSHPSAKVRPFALAARALIWDAHVRQSAAATKIRSAWTHSPCFRDLLPEPAPGEDILDMFQRLEREQAAKRDAETAENERKWAERRQQRAVQLKEYEDGCRKAHLSSQIAWPGIIRVLGARHSESGYSDIRFSLVDQIKHPKDGWMRDAAKRFLTEHPLQHSLDSSSGTLAVLALATCLDELDRQSEVSQAVAHHWLAEFIYVLTFCALGDAPPGLSKMRLCTLFPLEFSISFGKYLRHQLSHDGGLHELSGFADFWLPEMSSELFTALIEVPVSPKGFVNGMLALQQHAPQHVPQVATRWLPEIDKISDKDQKAALLAGILLASQGHSWTGVKAGIQEDKHIEKALWLLVARSLDRDERPVTFIHWPDAALAEVASLAWRAFPTEKERELGYEFRQILPEDDARDLRDQITSEAISRGFPPTIEAQMDESAQQREVRQRTVVWQRELARSARLSQAWRPFSVAEFLHLAQRPHARLARNADELLSAVVESLQRWEEHLRSGDWHRLWDHTLPKSKPEKIIAREMRQWLKQNLDLLAETEVELASEDRADILVQVTPRTAVTSPLSVVIEVKKLRKSNTRERAVAMKTQLLDLYLSPRRHEGWTHGLYVVTWTAEPGSQDDCEEAIQQAASKLSIQAKELSQHSFTLRSLVLDTRCREKRPRATRLSRKSANLTTGAAV